jgi:hypothetical protein
VLPEIVEGTSGLIVGDRNYHSPRTSQELARMGVELLSPYSCQEERPHSHKECAAQPFSLPDRDRLLSTHRALLHKAGVGARHVAPYQSRLLRKVLSHTVAFVLNHQMANPPLQLSKLLF